MARVHPILLVLGQRTNRHLSSVIEVLAAYLPRARRLVLPGAEHSTLLEPSEPLLSAVRQFLRG